MRNPGVRIKVVGNTKSYTKPLSDDEEVFCKGIIEGKSYVDAAIDAGLWPEVKDREKIQGKAYNLLRTVRVKSYIAKNARTVTLFQERDYEVVKSHIYEIALGTATRESERLRDGETITLTESPSFRDQIAAAALLRQMLNDDKDRIIAPVKDIVVSDIEEIDRKTQEFVDRYSYRPIETRDRIRIKTIEGIVDAETDDVVEVDEDLPDERMNQIDRAMEAEFDEYRI